MQSDESYTQEHFFVKEIVDHRPKSSKISDWLEDNDKIKKTEYRIRWAEQYDDPKHDTWESAESKEIECPIIVANYAIFYKITVLIFPKIQVFLKIF